jgi:cap2 methyltransferase/cap3/cap4 methyltransferase
MNYLKTIRKINVDLYAKEVQRIPYNSYDDKKHLSLHLGQHKLFLTMLYFMVHYGHLSDTVVYPGAGSGGFNSFIISKMFPKHHFVLYDPEKFDKRLFNCPNIEIHQTLFTDEDVEEWKGKGILFISDIRNPDIGKTEHDVAMNEEIVSYDMNLQSEWVRKIRPVMSMLKFRLPWNEGRTTYWDGKIMIQPYAPLKSTETRLLTPGLQEREYDNMDYEERLAWHNQVRRNQRIYPTIPKVEPVWDAATEVKILYEYFTKIKKIIPTPGQLYLQMKKISELLYQKNLHIK